MWSYNCPFKVLKLVVSAGKLSRKHQERHVRFNELDINNDKVHCWQVQTNGHGLFQNIMDARLQ